MHMRLLILACLGGCFGRPGLTFFDTSRFDTFETGDTSDTDMSVPPPDTDIDTPPPVDADGDGYFAGVDCNDADPAVHPDVDEVCDDGADNDCDQLVDAADPTCGTPMPIEDGDGDGYSPAHDCDDADAAVHPDAVEDCADRVDNDCDQLIDLADPTCRP